MTETKKVCVACGHSDMAFDTRDIPFGYHGKTTVVPQVPGWYCAHCGEGYLDDGGRHAEAITAFVRAVKAVEASEVRSIRKKLGLKQAEAGQLFGGGVNAFSEYERGKTQPHKSTLLLLKLLNRHPDLLSEIA
jgi:HTH-type transcriptional regulator/antitoxin MqsA